MSVTARPRATRHRVATPQERAAQLLSDERAHVRSMRWVMAQTLGGCIICCVLGIALVAWAVHTTDPGWGNIAFWSGLLLGDGGMMFLLLRYAKRATDDE